MSANSELKPKLRVKWYAVDADQVRGICPYDSTCETYGSGEKRQKKNALVHYAIKIIFIDNNTLVVWYGVDKKGRDEDLTTLLDAYAPIDSPREGEES